MGILQYSTRRLLLIIPVLLIVSILDFSIMHLAPGNPVQVMVNPQMGKEAIQTEKEKLGLDKPLPVQYFMFMKRIFTGNLGKSIYTKQPIGELIMQRLPNTLILGVTALGLALMVAIPLGAIAANFHGTLIDHFTMLVALVGLSMPQFWLGLVLMLIFSVKLGWFPVAGYGDLRHLVLPTITLSAYFIGLMSRLTRSSLLEELGKDYIRTARSKGLGEIIVFYKHALRNAITSVISLLGLQMGWLIGGAVMVELVFNRPGLGRLIIQSLYKRDYPVIQVLLLALVLSVMIANIVADILYALAQPKIRYS